MKKVAKNEEKTSFETAQHDVFTLIKVNDKVKIALGNTQITPEEFETIEDAKKFIDSKPYQLIINASCFVYEMTQKTL